MPESGDNVFLIGPMGSGKTTIGQRLAGLLGLEFLDCDRELEARTGASVSLIFDVEGEQGGAAASYEYSQLLRDDGNENWPFSFRYFQDFDREIVLPDGFTPERITIQVRSKTRSIDRRSWIWLRAFKKRWFGLWPRGQRVPHGATR